MPEDHEDNELNNSDYLKDLSERLRNIPVMYGIDGYDIDRLRSMGTEVGNES